MEWPEVLAPLAVLALPVVQWVAVAASCFEISIEWVPCWDQPGWEPQSLGTAREAAQAPRLGLRQLGPWLPAVPVQGVATKLRCLPYH